MGKTIGITGGIATGKTTVSKMITEAGYKVIDADRIAHEVEAKNTIGLKLIVDKFGKIVLRTDGSLDRKKLGKIVFNDKNKLQELNGILQPIIKQKLLSEISSAKEGQETVFFEIQLLFERGYQEYLDKTIVVYSSKKVEISRLMTRNHLSLDEAQKRVRAQMDLDQKVKMADVVIRNNSDQKSLREQVDQLLIQL